MNTIINISLLLLTSCLKSNDLNLKQKVIEKNRFFKKGKIIECSGDINLINVLENNNIFNEEFVVIKTKGNIYLNDRIEVRNLKIEANDFINNNSIIGNRLTIKSSKLYNKGNLNFEFLTLKCSKIFNEHHTSNILSFQDIMSLQARESKIITNHIENDGRIIADKMIINSKELHDIRIVNKKEIYIKDLEIEAPFDVSNYRDLKFEEAKLNIKSLHNRGYIGFRCSKICTDTTSSIIHRIILSKSMPKNRFDLDRERELKCICKYNENRYLEGCLERSKSLTLIADEFDNLADSKYINPSGIYIHKIRIRCNKFNNLTGIISAKSINISCNTFEDRGIMSFEDSLNFLGKNILKA